MNKYLIWFHDETEAEIEADKCLITNNGDVKFTTKQGSLVVAYAAGHWLEVTRLEGEPTAEQSDTGYGQEGMGPSLT